MKVTMPVKIVLGLVVGFFAYTLAVHYGYFPGAFVQKASVPQGVDLPSASDVPSFPMASPVAVAPLPTSAPGKASGPQVRVNIWAWNAQMGFIFANGGPTTTAGSLMEKHGVRLQINRQDDTEKSKPDHIKFAQLVANGDANPSEGIQFVIIMGDGAAQYIAGVDKALTKLGPDYRAEIVGAVGYSRGEDAFMGPQEWKDNPSASKGGLTAGVLRDGDWNIALDWLNKNKLKNNADEKLWAADSLNWVSADDYLKAAEMYITGYCEDRFIVVDGKKTNDKKHVCVDSVVTWTPGDVNIAKKKGGLVKILSTKENAYQMPAVLIGIHKWDVDHAKTVQGLLAASFDGADQVKTYDAALQRAAKASQTVYAEESAGYWLKYYKGTPATGPGVERDKTGVPVPLGGSTVMNLGDNLVAFGLVGDSGGVGNSIFKATYEGFGNVVKQQYPLILPSFPPAKDAVNTSFLTALQASSPESKPDVAKFEEPAVPITAENQVAKRDWSIQFDTGKATFTSAAQATLDDLYNQLAINTLSIEIDGHTDNVGDSARNFVLSKARAQKVSDYLQSKAPTLFPSNRIQVTPFGDARPVASNSTPDGRAQNRRVTIILGTK